MAVVIPLVAAYASGAMATAATFAAAGAMTAAAIGSYLVVGGAVLSTVGALTDNKKLQRFGSLMSLGGGLVSLASSVGSTAANGSAGADFAGSTAGEGVVAAQDAAIAADIAANEAGGAVADEAATALAEKGAEAAGSFASEPVNPSGSANVQPLDTGQATGSALEQAAAEAIEKNGSLAGESLDALQADSLMERVLAGTETATPEVSTLGIDRLGQQAYSLNDIGGVPSALQEGAAGLDNSSLTAGLDKLGKSVGQGMDWVGEKLGAADKWIQANPRIAKVGGDLLNGMYGPQAQQLDLMREREAQSQSILERRLANLNSPVRLSYRPNGG